MDQLYSKAITRFVGQVLVIATIPILGAQAQNNPSLSSQRSSMDLVSSDSTAQLIEQRRKEEYQSSMPEAMQLTASIKARIEEIDKGAARRISVRTDDENVVTLRGSAGTLQQRKQIEQAAEELAGWAYVRSFLAPR